MIKLIPHFPKSGFRFRYYHHPNSSPARKYIACRRLSAGLYLGNPLDFYRFKEV